MKRKQIVTIAVTAAMLAVLVATAMSAQDKYGLKTSSGIAFSDFRGTRAGRSSPAPRPTRC